MNEEEKEAIEYLKEICNDYIRFFEEEHAKKCLDYKRSKALINLIEKQQKEIEQMQTKINKIVLMIRENYDSEWYDDYETIAGLRDDIYILLTKNIGE